MSSPIDWSIISNNEEIVEESQMSDNIGMEIIANNYMSNVQETLLNDMSHSIQYEDITSTDMNGHILETEIVQDRYIISNNEQVISTDPDSNLDVKIDSSNMDIENSYMDNSVANNAQSEIEIHTGEYEQNVDDVIGAIEEVKGDSYYIESYDSINDIEISPNDVYDNDKISPNNIVDVNESDIIVMENIELDKKPKRASKKRQFAHRLQWKNDDMIAAMKAVEEENYTLRGSAKKFGVPYSSLKDRVQGRVQHGVKPGVKTILSPEEEDELKNYIADIQRCGFNISNWQVRERAAEMLMLYRGHQNPYSGGIPGQNWLAGFLKRHPTVEIKKTINRESQPSFFEQKVMFNEFFSLVNHLYQKHSYNVKPSRIFAMNDFKVSGFNEIRMIWAIAADGSHLPPFIIVRGNSVKFAAARQTYPDAYFVCTRDGMVTSETLLWWFRDHFVRKTNASYSNPCLLFMSQSIQDISFQMMQVANEQRVHIVNIPLSASNVIHPLDDQLTSLVDQLAFQKARHWKETVGTPFTYRILSQTLLSVWENDLDSEMIMHKFKSKLLFPLNQDSLTDASIQETVNFCKYDEEPCFNGIHVRNMTPPPVEDPRNVDSLNSHYDDQNNILSNIAISRTKKGDKNWPNSIMWPATKKRSKYKTRKSEEKKIFTFDNYQQHRQLTQAIQSIMPPVDCGNFELENSQVFSDQSRVNNNYEDVKFDVPVNEVIVSSYEENDKSLHKYVSKKNIPLKVEIIDPSTPRKFNHSGKNIKVIHINKSNQKIVTLKNPKTFISETSSHVE
ncbi:hypothetical protein A3Q56_01979 [Intoshia linei]|uniref:HTH CENPB-type domain-containing protein n=1 Tax=Intoshia linei TaxID=1819745 RepID=A0A177B9D5_9BILA|nr:hypothetical protein A3Q56_01979 [Intoshia linei]